MTYSIMLKELKIFHKYIYYVLHSTFKQVKHVNLQLDVNIQII